MPKTYSPDLDVWRDGGVAVRRAAGCAGTGWGDGRGEAGNGGEGARGGAGRERQGPGCAEGAGE
jgi:hypothetical protein